jgi:phospholipase/carboxylesterase
MLGFAAAEALHQLLESAGWQGEFVAFGGGHEIPGAALRSLAALLTACQPVK